MEKAIFIFLILLILSGCASPAVPETIPPETTTPETTSASLPTVPETVPTTAATIAAETETTAPPAEPVVILTEEEKTMLLKIGMAELGQGDCTECIALVMRTVLNRVEAGRFGRGIYGVLHAPEQFTPVMNGTYAAAEPNERCQEALNMVICGWDESQGALYYEFCKGESWHSKNLHLLFQHCDTRFYD